MHGTYSVKNNKLFTHNNLRLQALFLKIFVNSRIFVAQEPFFCPRMSTVVKL